VEDKMSDKENGTHEEFVGTLTRVVALIVGIALFVSDRYLHMVDPPVDTMIYGVIASIAMGNKQALGLLGMAGKK
jgi:hypothetical protein